MAVNFSPADPAKLLPVPGVRLGVAEASIRKPNRKDLLLIEICEGSRVAGVFTQNRFCAAPVIVAKRHLASGKGVRALVVNTGCANAGTGADGFARARATCEAVAASLNIAADQVLPFSTGVIMEPLPVERIKAGLPACVADLRADNWLSAACAIMTTDTVAKVASAQINVAGRLVTITGIAKGAGMIRPNMATMLSFVACDAAISASLLEALTRDVADQSFNRVTVDGDTSTNDAFVIVATGRAANPQLGVPSDTGYSELRDVACQVACQLAQAIARDGEGATKFITVCVEGGRDETECKKVAYAIAHSPLVKTAFFACDPNLGRILAAIGSADVEDLDVNGVQLYLNDVLVAESGGRAATYTEADGERVMRQAEILIRVLLNRARARTTIWTCDLSYDYVKINADYRT